MTDGFGVQTASQEDGRARAAVLLWWVIALSFVYRVVFAMFMPLGLDETYTAVMSRQLHLSYYDHPPVHLWLAWAARTLFGSADPIVLRLPFLLLFPFSTWLMYRLTEVLFGARAGLWAAVAMSLSPVLGAAYGSWILPDGPLMAAMLAAGLFLAKVFFEPDGRATLYWVGAGFFGSLAMLSKYQGVFVFAGALLFVLSVRGERRWLAHPGPYLGTLVALIVFAPVLIWNAEHDWISFRFQGARASVAAMRPSQPLVMLLGQMVYLAPWIWVPLVLATFYALRRGPHDRRSWLPLCLGLPLVLTFLCIAFWSTNRMLPSWAVPGYLMLFPLLGMAIARYEQRATGVRWLRRWLYGSVAFLIGAGVVVVAEVHLGWDERLVPGIAAKRDPVRELLDWRELKIALRERGLLGRSDVFMIVPNWQQAAKASYALGAAMPVLCISRDPRQFNIVNDPAAEDGKDALIVGSRLPPDKVAHDFGQAFMSIRPLPPITIDHAGHPAIKLDVYYATGFDAGKVDYGWLKN